MRNSFDPVTTENAAAEAVQAGEAAKNRYKDKVFTLPNMLSVLRLLMIPVIVWLYLGKKNYPATLAVLVLSGITDVVDGMIARKFGMISDLGKALDPIADKLTQIAALFCLVSRFRHMLVPLGILIIKEFFTGIVNLISIKRTKAVKSAVWHGKLTTVSLYVMLGLHLIWYSIPDSVSLVTAGVCVGIMLMSFIMYSVMYIRAIRNRSYDD